jgi:hypothetical protein
MADVSAACAGVALAHVARAKTQRPTRVMLPYVSDEKPFNARLRFAPRP